MTFGSLLQSNAGCDYFGTGGSRKFPLVSLINQFGAPTFRHRFETWRGSSRSPWVARNLGSLSVGLGRPV
jgi:hypothetical protein